MTDLQYDTLCILLETKQVTKGDLEAIYIWLGSAYDDWGWVIAWLSEKSDVPPKIRPRVDYGTVKPTP